MSYRVRFTTPSGIKGRWASDYTTREDAQRAIDDHVANTGFAYAVEEVLEPGSTAAHHVEILRARVKELDAELASLKTSLAASPQGTAKASQAPREGGDSDRRRLEALERFIKGKYCESIIWQGDAFGAISEIVAIEAPTLATLADKLAEKEAKL